jgi:hypothetical protein
MNNEYRKARYYYEYTQFPKIFSKTYWGNFKLLNEHPCPEYIFENRNEFIKYFNIKSVYKMPYNMQKKYDYIFKEGDHFEIYKTNDKKIIIVNSPYHHREVHNSFIKCKPMYNSDATSYYLIIE